MKRFSVAVLIGFALASCDHTPAPVTQNDTVQASAPIVKSDSLITVPNETIPTDTVQSCYTFSQGEKHNWMVMTRIADSVYGDLHFTWQGKDGANGKFEGSFQGDTLWGIFHSVIEGNSIDREISYLISGDKLLEGEGVQVANDKGTFYRFKYKKMVEYSKTEYLAKGPCM